MNKDFAYHQISLKLILKNSEGKILLLKALPDDGNFAGFYDLPGGRIHDEERKNSFEEILRREVYEEAGEINFSFDPAPVALGRLFNDEKNYSVLYIFFEGIFLSGEVKISAEHTEAIWVDLNKISLQEYFTSGILDGMRTYFSMKNVQ